MLLGWIRCCPKCCDFSSVCCHQILTFLHQYYQKSCGEWCSFWNPWGFQHVLRRTLQNTSRERSQENAEAIPQQCIPVQHHFKISLIQRLTDYIIIYPDLSCLVCGEVWRFCCYIWHRKESQLGRNFPCSGVARGTSKPLEEMESSETSLNTMFLN